MSSDKKIPSYEQEILHGLWVEKELRIVAAEPTFLLIAWVFVPAWSLWRAFGPQGAKNVEEGLAFPPVVSPILVLSFLAATTSVLSQLFLPATIRNTPPDGWTVREIQHTTRTKTRVVYLLQMASCVLYQAVVACTWVQDRYSFSLFDLAPVVYMFAVTGVIHTVSFGLIKCREINVYRHLSPIVGDTCSSEDSVTTPKRRQKQQSQE